MTVAGKSRGAKLSAFVAAIADDRAPLFDSEFHFISL